MSKRKAAVVSVVVGFAVAAGVFAGFGFPGTLQAADSDSRYGLNVAVDEVVNVGLGPFHAGGPREIEIISVSLVDPSPAVVLDAIRLSRAGSSGGVELGADKGEREDLATLPSPLGVVLRPGDDGGFWVTLRVSAAGMHSIQGIKVTYRSGWITRTTVVGPPLRLRVIETRGPRGGGEGGGRTRRSSTRTRSA